MMSFAGSIPPEFGQLRALKELYLSFNQLSGEMNMDLKLFGIAPRRACW